MPGTNPARFVTLSYTDLTSASKLRPSYSRPSLRTTELRCDMLRRLRDFEWTFSNTAEAVTALLLATAIVAVFA